MRLVACISSGSSDSIVRALPLLVGRLASRPSIRNEFYRYRQISPFKPSEFSRNIYPRFIPRIYIPSSRLNGRHFFETSLGPFELSTTVENTSPSSSLKFERSFEAREGGRGKKESCFPGRSLEIFLHRNLEPGTSPEIRFLMNRNLGDNLEFKGRQISSPLCTNNCCELENFPPLLSEDNQFGRKFPK